MLKHITVTLRRIAHVLPETRWCYKREWPTADQRWWGRKSQLFQEFRTNRSIFRKCWRFLKSNSRQFYERCLFCVTISVSDPCTRLHKHVISCDAFPQIALAMGFLLQKEWAGCARFRDRVLVLWAGCACGGNRAPVTLRPIAHVLTATWRY